MPHGLKRGLEPGGTALLSRRTHADSAARQEDYVDRLATLPHNGKLVEHRPLRALGSRVDLDPRPGAADQQRRHVEADRDLWRPTIARVSPRRFSLDRQGRVGGGGFA